MHEGLERPKDLFSEFNPFDVLKIERRETQRSELLAWLHVQVHRSQAWPQTPGFGRIADDVSVEAEAHGATTPG